MFCPWLIRFNTQQNISICTFGSNYYVSRSDMFLWINIALFATVHGVREVVWGGSSFDQSRMENLGSPLHVWCTQLPNWTTVPSGHSPYQLPLSWKAPFNTTVTMIQFPLLIFHIKLLGKIPNSAEGESFFVILLSKETSTRVPRNDGLRVSAILHWNLISITEPFGLHACRSWYSSARM
jgi:hypothetical protein